jgi:hypothetical protein
MKAPYYAQIKQWAKQGADGGQFVFVRIGERLIAALPDSDRELGNVAAEDQIVVSRKLGPAGFVYDVEIKRGG